MKISTVREFRENAAVMLRSRAPIVVTRRGKLAGVFFPQPEVALPIDFKREPFPGFRTRWPDSSRPAS